MDKNISKVYEEIKHLLSDEEILAVAEAREKQFLDYNSAINHATRRGHQEGKIEGIQEGIETGKLAVAKKMLTSFSDQEIVELTELDIDVIKELRREIILDNYQDPMNRGLIEDDTYIKVNTNSESCIILYSHTISDYIHIFYSLFYCCK